MISRRRFLQMAGAGAAGLVSGGFGSLLDSQPADAQTKPNRNFMPDLNIPESYQFGNIAKRRLA